MTGIVKLPSKEIYLVRNSKLEFDIETANSGGSDFFRVQLLTVAFPKEFEGKTVRFKVEVVD